jgi:hypothetical protein
MRTKTLLLIAAIGAAGAATSMAQVFSVNAVGYVNKTIPKNGFAMVSNPLKAATNTINALFQPVPVGFQVFVYTPGKGFDVGTFDDLEGAFLPASVGNATLLPGQGVFVKNPTASDVTITFVGEVPQGSLSTPLVAGLQIVSSQVPQAGTASDLGLPHTTAGGMTAGDQVYQFVTNDAVAANNQKYYVSTFDDLEDNFLPALKPLDVGEAIFLKLAKANTWKRDFSVNQ